MEVEEALAAVFALHDSNLSSFSSDLDVSEDDEDGWLSADDSDAVSDESSDDGVRTCFQTLLGCLVNIYSLYCFDQYIKICKFSALSKSVWVVIQSIYGKKSKT